MKMKRSRPEFGQPACDSRTRRHAVSPNSLNQLPGHVRSGYGPRYPQVSGAGVRYDAGRTPEIACTVKTSVQRRQGFP